MKLKFIFPIKHILSIMLFIIVHQAFSKAYSPKSLNSIPDRLVGIIQTSNPHATLEYMFSDGPNTDVIRLTYPDNQTFLCYYLFNNNDSYQLEVIDISTGKKELFYKTILQNGEKIHVSLPVVDMIQSPDATSAPTKSPTESTQKDPIPKPQQYYPEDHNDSQPFGANDYDTPLENPTKLSADNDSWFSSTTLIGCGLGGFVIFGLYYIMEQGKACARYLYGEDLWSTWKSEESYNILLMMEPEYLVDDLIEAIHVRYYEQENPIDLFFADVKEEYETILKWMQFRNMVLTMWLPVGPDFYTLEDRLALLELLRKTADYWRAQQLRTKQTSKSKIANNNDS